MEKVIYVVWSEAAASIATELRGDGAAQLVEAGACNIQLNVDDDAVADAAPSRIASSGAGPVATISMWLDTAIDQRRAPIDALVSGTVLRVAGAKIAGYLVTESVPLANTAHPPIVGSRTHGYSQIACLTRPPTLQPDEWRSMWQNDHTQIALDTQSTFGYVQNLVVRPLTPDAPPYVAIVEELFPPDAMTSPHVFFDAVGDDDRLQSNITAMIGSTSRFLDFDQIDVFPTSQYVLDSIAPIAAGA